MSDQEAEAQAADELAKRRAIGDAVDDIASSLHDIVFALEQLTDIGKTPQQIIELAFAAMSPGVAEKLAPLQRYGQSIFEQLYVLDNPSGTIRAAPGTDPQLERLLEVASNTGISGRERRMGELLDRLFANAPQLQDGSGKPVEGQAPALPEVSVRTISGHEMQGVLSRTDENMFRVMAPATMGNRRVMIEQFFDLTDIEVIGFAREVVVQRGSIITT